MTRRGACPTLSQPMRTGDGLLVRLSPVGGFAPDGFIGLAQVAAEFGNGLIDISARGNLQIRGLRDESVAAFAERIATLGIVPPDGPAIAINPLAGLAAYACSDPTPIAHAIRTLLAERSQPLGLAPKIAIVIDGGGALHLDALSADIRLIADDGNWLLALGGDGGTALPVSLVTTDEAPRIVVALLELIAVRGRDTRARTLLDRDPAWFETVVRQSPPAPRSAREPAQPIGRHLLDDGSFAAGFGLAFGQIAAADMIALGRAAADSGARDIRPAPGQAVLVAGLAAEAANRLAAIARTLGLLVDPADPRRNISACVGRPACSSAQLATRRIAADIVRHADSLLRDGIAVHVSGCAKGCAHPAASALTLVGADGGCGIVIDGKASSPPMARLAEAALPIFMNQLAASHPDGKRIEPSAVEAALTGPTP